MIIYNDKQFEDANMLIKQTADTMEEIKGYVQSHDGKYDKYDHVEEMLDKASKGHDSLKIKKYADVISNLTDSSKSEFYDGYVKKCSIEWQKQQEQTKTINGPGYKLQQPSNNIIRGQKLQTEAQRQIQQATQEGSKYISQEPQGQSLGPVLK